MPIRCMRVVRNAGAKAHDVPVLRVVGAAHVQDVVRRREEAAAKARGVLTSDSRVNRALVVCSAGGYCGRPLGQRGEWTGGTSKSGKEQARGQPSGAPHNGAAGAHAVGSPLHTTAAVSVEGGARLLMI